LEIADGSRRPEDFSFREMGLSGLGTALAVPAFITAPWLAVPAATAIGLDSAQNEYRKGNWRTGTFDLVTALLPWGSRTVRTGVFRRMSLPEAYVLLDLEKPGGVSGGWFARLLPWNYKNGKFDPIVRVHRMHATDATGEVRGGAYRRAIEAGKTPAEAEAIWQKLMDKVNSSDPKKAVKALEDAQASGNKSPFISTTFKPKADLIRTILDLRDKGILTDFEVLTIVGRLSKGVDFEARFETLGGRLSPSRMKDAALAEFGIPEKSVPYEGESPGGFRVRKVQQPPPLPPKPASPPP
jgi:hypothetical protein